MIKTLIAADRTNKLASRQAEENRLAVLPDFFGYLNFHISVSCRNVSQIEPHFPQRAKEKGG